MPPVPTIVTSPTGHALWGLFVWLLNARGGYDPEKRACDHVPTERKEKAGEQHTLDAVQWGWSLDMLALRFPSPDARKALKFWQEVTQ